MAKSKEVVHKVTATLVSTEEAFLPKTQEEFKGELPATREECLRSLVANVAYAQKQNALRMWFVGKIVSTLNDRGEANVFEEVTKLTGFKQRSLYQCIAVYKEFEDPDYIADIGKVLNWTNVRNLLNIKNPEKRKKICDRILEGELTDGNVDTAIKTTVAEERKEKEKEKEDDPDAKDPVGPKPKRPNPSVVFTKIENNFLNFKKTCQEMEAEYVEMCRYVWNPELVESLDFSKHMDIAERAVNALKALEKEIKSMVPIFVTNLEDDPLKKDK
jgi:hypothetical protein